MKTITKIHKNILSKLIRVLMFGVILCFSFKADAQCVAGFTYVINPANNGQVTFTNTSTGGSSTLVSYWTFDVAGTSSLTTPPTITFPTTGSYTVCLEVTATDSSCVSYTCDSLYVINNSTGIHENSNSIATLENYPNPISNSTTINYAINKDALVSISIIDLLGNTIAELESGNKSSGEYSTTWNAENISEGMYLLQLKVNNDISTKKIIVNK